MKDYRKVWLLNIWFKPYGWPWQIKTRSGVLDVGGKSIGEKWGWKLNTGGMGRFGGGWHWKLGILAGGTTIIIDLILGGIRFTTKEPK